MLSGCVFSRMNARLIAKEQEELKQRKKKKQKARKEDDISGVGASEVRGFKKAQVADFFRKHLSLSSCGIALSSMEMDEIVKDDFFIQQDKSKQQMSIKDLIIALAPSAV